MKKIFLAFTITLALSVALTKKTAAQDILEISEEDRNILYGPVMIINQSANPSIAGDLKNINERAVKNFHKNYPSVTNEEWAVSNDHGYLAMFNAGGNQTVVGYDHKGVLHHTINYYGEEKLTHELRHIVKSVYYDYSITRVAEVNINDWDAQKTFVVFIQHGSSLKKVTICNDEILSVQDTLKG